MKKRALALVLTAAMVLGLTACGGSATETTTSDAATEETTTEDSTAEATDDQTADEADAAASAGEKILSVQVGPDPETIDPALNSAVDGGNMLLHSFECLLAVD